MKEECGRWCKSFCSVEHQIQNVFFSPRLALRNNAMLFKKTIYDFFDERLVPLTTIFLPNFSLAKHGPIAIVETSWVDVSHKQHRDLHHQLHRYELKIGRTKNQKQSSFEIK